MKKLKKIISLFAAAAMLVMLPGENVLTASAAEPTTYYVKYLAEDDEWRFQTGTAWDESVAHRELYYMEQDIKDGDAVIIDGANTTLNISLSAHLENLTIRNSSTIIIATEGIDNCFVLGNSITAVNGDIANAYVYDNASCTFNNNITTLQILGASDINANVTVAGTVAHLIGKDDLTTYYDFYNVAAGKLSIENGTVKTKEEYYSTTASNTPTATTPPASSTQAPAAPSQPSSSGEYDDVPKTGEGNLIFWLTGIAAICLAGKYALKKAQ